jgi:predicted acetyltransferase
MSMAELVTPQQQYFDGFVEAEAEYRREGRRQLVSVDVLTARVEDVLAYYDDLRAGRNLAPHLVPSSTFWMIDGGQFIGGVSVRHELNDSLRHFGGHIGYMIRPSARRRGYGKHILKLALPKAHDLGIVTALVTCDATNTASRKIIEANGGIFENEVEQGPGLPPKRRYWIVTGNG